jgi:hypothetical protein
MEHKSIYAAIRSCSLRPYDGIQQDWKNEREFHRLMGMKRFINAHKVSWTEVLASIRKKFSEDTTLAQRGQRIDLGFKHLRQLSEHNALIRTFENHGIFDVKVYSYNLTLSMLVAVFIFVLDNI